MATELQLAIGMLTVMPQAPSQCGRHACTQTHMQDSKGVTFDTGPPLFQAALQPLILLPPPPQVFALQKCSTTKSAENKAFRIMGSHGEQRATQKTDLQSNLQADSWT